MIIIETHPETSSEDQQLCLYATAYSHTWQIAHGKDNYHSSFSNGLHKRLTGIQKYVFLIANLQNRRLHHTILFTKAGVDWSCKLGMHYKPMKH